MILEPGMCQGDWRAECGAQDVLRRAAGARDAAL